MRPRWSKQNEQDASCVAWRTTLKVIMAGVLLASFMESAAEEKIYLSYEGTSKDMPSYTDRPINSNSRIVAIVHPQTQRSVFIALPAGVTMLPRRNMRLVARQSDFDQLIKRAADTHGVDAALVNAVIEVESGFNAQARSPKGATGLMQVMPATAARYGQFNLGVPEQNIDVGTRYLRELLTLFNGNVQLAVAAYNSGENAVIQHGGKVPPYPETQRYVPLVLERYKHYMLKSSASANELPVALESRVSRRNAPISGHTTLVLFQ